MQSSAAARRAWDQVMAEAGQGPIASKSRKRGNRSSGRLRQTGASGGAMVDDEVRRQVKHSQLELYEADNYKQAEEQVDEEYVDSDEELSIGKKPTKRTRTSKKTSKGKSKRRIRKLMDLILKEGIDPSKPNYLSASVGPPSVPPHRICAVCGGPSKFVNKRTGVKLCSSKCDKYYEETKGMRFG